MRLSCHPIHELISLLRRHQPQQSMCPSPDMRPACFHNPDGPRPPETSPHNACEKEARDGEQYPVSSHPKDRLGILPVPTASLDDVEEAPAMPLVLIRHQDPHALCSRRRRANVLLPDHRQEERARTVHDGDVRHAPVAVIGLQ